MEPKPADGISAVIGKVLTTTDPWWWLGALAILVGLPILLVKLPEIIGAISAYHDTYRKTSHKIKTERAKMERAMADRTVAGGSAKKGK